MRMRISDEHVDQLIKHAEGLNTLCSLLLCANYTIIPFLFQRDYKCLGEGNILVITPLLPRIQG